MKKGGCLELKWNGVEIKVQNNKKNKWKNGETSRLQGSSNREK
jgi:hypothetical protein